MQKISTLREVKVLLYFLLSLFFVVLFTSKITAQNTAITIQPLKDITLNCSDNLPTATKPTATTTCKGEGVLKFSMQESTQGLCPKLITRLWTVTDPCGNKNSATQKIYIFDNSAPKLYNVPTSIIVACGEVPKFPTDVTAKDKCDDKVQLYIKDTKYSAICDYNYKIRREFVATDRCGNMQTQTQIITVQDSKAPVFTTNLQNVTVSCANVPPVVKPTATDNCSAAAFINIYLSETRANLGCKDSYTIKRTWTAKDQCGKTATMVQMITVRDIEKPTFVSIPNNLTLECNELTPAATNLTAKDNCDLQVDIVLKNTIKYSICINNYQIIREWTATDNCSNKSTITQTITVSDTKAPVFVSETKDIMLACGDAIPTNSQPIITDNCDRKVALSFKETTETTNCNTLIKRTWKATDICGNSIVKDQTITLIDSIKPVFQPIVADITVQCGIAPALPTVVVTDNCDKNPKITFKEEVMTSTGTIGCNGKVVRTWTATDRCGNSTFIKQTISIKDAEVPVFVKTPNDITVECSQMNTIANPIVKDNCTDKITFIFKDETKQNADPTDSCTLLKVRTWVASDLCGNTATATQNITITDKIAPIVAVFPKDVSVFCSDTMPQKPKLSFSDACSPKVYVTYTEQTAVDSVALNGSYTLVRKWVATDHCGNSKVIVQNVYVSTLDMKPPVLITAGMFDEITLECSDTSANRLLRNPIIPKATDDCDKNVLVTYSDDKILETCGNNSYIILRTWKATDDAGNTDEFQQFFALTDYTPPVIYNVPADITLACGETPPPVPNTIFAVDTCGTTMFSDVIEIDFQEVKYAGQCPNGIGQIKRFWTAVDSCENTTNKIQVITFSNSIITKVAKNATKEQIFVDRREMLEEQNAHIKVYPNPTTGTTYISLPKNTDMMLISNELGQIKYTLNNPREGINTVEMRDWNDGIYIIQIKTQDKVQTQKAYLQTH